MICCRCLIIHDGEILQSHAAITVYDGQALCQLCLNSKLEQNTPAQGEMPTGRME